MSIQFLQFLHKLGLKLKPEKTWLTEFGRLAIQDRKARGEDKPDAFHFLEFTHIAELTQKGNLRSSENDAAAQKQIRPAGIQANSGGPDLQVEDD